MARKRVILELGTGNDLHGGDYTKAALRAVQDALHHSSLTMLRALKVNSKTDMFVNVTIGVQQPDKVDAREGEGLAAARHRHGEGGEGRARRRRSREPRSGGDRQRRRRGETGAAVMLLYEHPLSSYAQKVKIALREKGVAFDVETPQALGSGNAAGPFAAASPRNEVPALIDGEARIFDSTIILEYLEDKYPDAAAAAARSAGARRGAHDRGCLRHALRGDQLGPERDPLVQARRGSDRPRRCGPRPRAQTRRAAGLADGQARRPRLVQRRRASAGPTSASRPTSTARSTTASARPTARRSRAGATRIRERPSVAATFKEFEAAAGGMGDAPGRLASGAIRREYRDHRLEWMMKSGGVQIVLDGLAKNNIRFTWPL